MSVKQPLIQQKTTLRLAIALFLVAGLFFAWHYLSNLFTDPDLGSVNSTGWIAAIQQTGNGSQAVVLMPDGKIVPSPNYRDGAEDRDITWQPDGQRLIFSSNREDNAFHIYRWNPAKKVTERRSIGTRAQEKPTYALNSSLTPPFNALVISSGVIVEFDAAHSTQRQILPLEGRTPTQSGEEAGGSGSQFGPEYEKLGTSYRQAAWSKDHKYIISVMQRDDVQTLVLQCLEPADPKAVTGKAGSPLEDGRPHGLIAGDHIDISVDPQSGNIAYTVHNFSFLDPAEIPPQFIKGGKAIRPYRNCLGFLNPDDPTNSGPVAYTNDPSGFAQPAVSPDGSRVACIIGNDVDGNFTPAGLAVFPFRVQGGTQATGLVKGKVHSPAWSPDSSKIVFSIGVGDGKQDLETVDISSGAITNLTHGVGTFSNPSYSPQTQAQAPATGK